MGHFKRTRSEPPARRIRQMLFALSLGLSVVVLIWQMVLTTGGADEGARRREGGLVQIDSRIYFVEPGDEDGDDNGSEAQGESSGAGADSKKRSKADSDAVSEREQKASEKHRVDALLAEQGKPLNALPRNRRKKHEHQQRAGRRRAITARPGVRVLHSAVPQRSPHENVCGLYEHLDLPASNESGPQYTYRYRHVRVIRAPDEQHLCDKDTQVFAAINSGVFNFERRNAVRLCIEP